LGLVGGEHHPNQFGPPGRVVASHGEDSLTDRLGMGMIGRPGRAISRDQAGFALIADPLQEMTDRARREPERLGQGSHGFALGGSLLVFLPHRDGDGFGHRSGLRRKTSKRRMLTHFTKLPVAWQNLLSGLNGKTYRAVT
jgi:hypothetical protein